MTYSIRTSYVALSCLRYGDVWQNKSECQNMTGRFCNLTRETENFAECYYARVRAIVPNCCVSDWVMSPRFYPRKDTNIGSPEVKYTPSVQSIYFNVQAPYTPLRDENNQTLTVVDIFSQFGATVQYEITICCQKTQQKWLKIENNKEFEISDLDPNTEYNGTIHIRYLDKISEPNVFQVTTLPDNSWMPYVFGIALFMTVLIFGTIYYFIYKYMKQHTAQQPTALDFKDISRFQPLVLNVEQILTPYDLCKPTQLVPEKQPAQISQHLLGALEHQELFSLTETVYQQQAKAPSFQTIAQPASGAGDLPVGYTPQVVQKNPPCTLGDSPSTLTYGICFEGTNKANSPAKQAMKLDSLVEGSLSNKHYKVQKPEQIKRELWEKNPQQVLPAFVLGNAEGMLLQEDTQDVLQPLPSLLEERVPARSGERTGSYRKHPAELLPSVLENDQNAMSEGGAVLSTPPPSLFSHPACSSHTQDHNPGQWTAWHSLAWTDNQWQPLGFQTTDCITQARQGLKNDPGSLDTNPDTLDSAQNNGLFTGLFRDLELKLQWDQEPEGNAVAH
ncbi:interleukin-22 receptor subunit alpha-1 isoform X2 [Rhineura floridana]|uniref:interleukin-22 receptor subunit alpha-1 isoform X2 n=1 Tax=Rhineura floridana TaxID=261503 RepID=UPI002AC85BCD|nr:interleukin-22 receptor subunit alpha-1 isoform X2 [Rhineura floridana]